MSTQKLQRSYHTIRRALKGEQNDFTSGDLKESVILLAIPMILELSLESVFAIVDMFFVSQLGRNAIATVGLTESVITLIYSIAIGLSTSATAIVARRTGEKNYTAARKAGAQCLTLGLIISVTLALIGVPFASDILRIMGAEEEVVKNGTSFAQIMFGGNIVILFLFLINGIFRGAGNAAMAMRSLWLSSAINLILCPLFVKFFGLPGAAAATVIGRGVGVSYQLFHLLRPQANWKYFLPQFSALRGIIKIAFPATLQFIISSGSWILITKLVADLGGTAASAGSQIAFRNFVFFILPAWGLSNAASTIVGQNLGAGLPERAEQGARITMKMSAVFMTFVTLIFLLAAPQIVSIFTSDPEVLHFGTNALRVIGSGFIFYGVAMVCIQSLNGAGNTTAPTWINFLCLWAIQIPLALTISQFFGLGPIGVLAAVPISKASLAVLSYYRFEKGNWKLQKV